MAIIPNRRVTDQEVRDVAPEIVGLLSRYPTDSLSLFDFLVEVRSIIGCRPHGDLLSPWMIFEALRDIGFVCSIVNEQRCYIDGVPHHLYGGFVHYDMDRNT
jgi:hypothetical protein